MEVAARKRALRERLRRERRDAPPTEEDARQAAGRLTSLPEFAAARAVGLYVALPDELATGPILAAARDRGARVAVPRVQAAGRLSFHWVEGFDELERGRYGVREPADGSPAASLEALDLLVVPGLAFDETGARLGRGGGYYDRVLAARREGRPFRVGLSTAACVIGSVPCESFDERVDAVVTESRLVRCERGRGRAGR